MIIYTIHLADKYICHYSQVKLAKQYYQPWQKEKSFCNSLVIIVGYLTKRKNGLVIFRHLAVLLFFFFLCSLDQCERVLELLKQYQNLKSVLTTLIQKEETVISLQASYMGKENLKKRIVEVSPNSISGLAGEPNIERML